MSAAIKRNPFLFAIPVAILIILSALLVTRTGTPEETEQAIPHYILGPETVVAGDPADLMAIFVDEREEQTQPGAGTDPLAGYSMDRL